MADSAFLFAPSTGRYRDVASGRFVKQARVREGVDATVGLSADRMGDAAARLRAEEITVEQFQAEMLAHVKDVHVSNALAAYGGREQMTPARWGYVGARIRTEYGYVRGMTSDILDGKQAMNGSLDARARQYAAAGRHTYTAVNRREAVNRGNGSERNVLGTAEHCADCSAQSARGWVPVGSLSQPGSRRCRGNCRCHIEFTSQSSEAAA